MKLAGHGKDPRLVQAELPIIPKVGDRIKDKDGFIGVITFISDRCITAESKESFKSYNLVELKDIHSFIKLLPEESLPEQDLHISISGEAIQGINSNSVPIAIAPNPIVDKSYIESFKVGDRVKFREGYTTNLEYELTTGTITDIDEINIRVIWEGENSPDVYTKFHIESKKWWERLESLPDANSVLVESDRLKLLLERKKKLIQSGASPQGVWLCSGKVPNRDFIQVVWKADKPHPWLGGAKSRYIGKLNSDEHLSAIAQHRAGQELRKIEREIKKLQVKS